jgi:Kef-type K+ transport system membrane component KefB
VEDWRPAVRVDVDFLDLKCKSRKARTANGLRPLPYMQLLDFVRSHLLALPALAKFAITLMIIVGVPPLSRRLRLPPAVGLLVAGLFIGPHGLGLFGAERPIADFFAEIGKLLLMFMAGLEVNLVLFKAAKNRAMTFGVLTTTVPLLFGTGVALLFGFQLVPAIVIGSLLASHTLLGLPTIMRLHETHLEPITVTIGATVMSDTLSLVVFAICVSTFQTGFSALTLTRQLVEIAVFVPLILFGLSRVGAWFLKKVGDHEDAYFIVMLAIVGVAGSIADTINLPPIVGAFLAGLAVNAAAQDQPAKEKLEFFGNALFIPCFFIATGFLIDPRNFLNSITGNFALVVSIIVALLVGKGIAAEIAGRMFKYSTAARRTVWSLTLPQVAATLAATLVGYNTFNPAGQRLLDVEMLNVVLVLVLTTSILGPVLTERFAPAMLPEASTPTPARLRPAS